MPTSALLVADSAAFLTELLILITEEGAFIDLPVTGAELSFVCLADAELSLIRELSFVLLSLAGFELTFLPASPLAREFCVRFPVFCV